MKFYTVTYKDGDSNLIESFVAKNISDLDGSISGVEMDNGHVLHVTDEKGNKVTAREIGSCQTEAF